MRFHSAVAAALLASSTCAARLSPRDYDSYDYYAVHLNPDVSPREVSDHLGLHYEGPLGELQDHHIFRASERHHDREHDHIDTAISDLKRRRWKREVSPDQPHILDHVLLSQKQQLHKRFPLVRRDVPLPRQSDSASPPPKQPTLLEQQSIDVAQELGIQDPIYDEQWHLFNTVQEGHDLNVTGLWQEGITGKGSTVCIVDDGLDLDSHDLMDNYFAAGSWDFNDQGPDPKPRLSDDRHGTRCAGEVAAVKNDVCGVGVAYDGKVSGVRILSKVISNADEAVALNYAFQDNHIYSCSWGPPDDGRSMDAPDVLIQRAMLTGVQKGRGGYGSIFVFAIGNGAAHDDDCNFDGYTNSIYSVSVGGIDRKGLHPYYSEKCSAQLVVTYSSGSGDAIHTTDVGEETCYAGHGGTSAAGPLVAGIYALALEANPKLTWRDIQYITVQTAIRIDQPSDWVMNKAIGKEFSHQFGYGKADAWALVQLAKTWESVKPQAWFFSPWLHVKHSIPQGETGLASYFTVTEEMIAEANLERLEHVTVTMNVEHTRRGDLSVDLISPSGMVSHIATHRRDDDAPQGYRDWTFMSVAHWGESGVGKWTVIIKDTKVNEHSGNFTDWRLKFYGESIDGDKQELLPMPNRHDDDDHDAAETQSAAVSTTSVSVPTETGKPPGNPDDHIHRPVNSKITTTTTTTSPVQPSASGYVPTTTSTSTAQPSASGYVPPPNEEDEQQPSASPTQPFSKPTSTTAKPSSSASSGSNFLPHPFPTFGVSKRTQIWIYGAISLILVFLVALGAWSIYMRRQRRRRWDDYAFEMVEHDDDPDGAGGRPNGNGYANGGPRGKGKRAGELYDAFAEGSDDGQMFGLGSDDEDDDEGVHGDDGGHLKEMHGRYRDEEPLREGSDVG